MSAQNGSLTPNKQQFDDEPSSGTKRKRSDTEEESIKALKTAPQDNQVSSQKVGKETFDDIVAILYQSEVGPSILNSPIPPTSHSQSAKKVKLSEPSTVQTISEKVAESSYADLKELEVDVASICDAQIADIKRPEDGATAKFKRLSEDDVAQMQDYMSLKSTVKDLVAQESRTRPNLTAKDYDAVKTNGIKAEETQQHTSLMPSAGRTVLSLYGNAQGPKQLFSSLQDDAATDLSLEELGLPNMLTATKLLPLPQDDAKSKARTFSDVFPPPSSLPDLQPPPKQPKMSSRNPTISFAPIEKPISRSAAKKMTYPYQPLSLGHWIRYGNPPRRKERQSEKQRDRSGSIVERERPQDIAPAPPREEDLFASAYSSFAPSYDNSRAVLGADARNLVWWQRCGKRKLDAIFALEQPEDEMEVDTLDDEDPVKLSAAHEKKIFEEVVEKFDPSLVDLPDVEPEKSPAELEAQELLIEINDLLQTLASYQRIRNSTIASHARTPSISSPSPMRSTLAGTPTEPAPEEVETYRALKERLAELVARLPPYTVAKMDGQQIEDLRVSTTILLENKSVRGVLEEDQITRLTKATQAAVASASAANRASNTGYNQYNRSTSLSGGRQALTPQAYTSNRAPSSYGRSSSNIPAATPTGQTNRHSYSNLGAQTAPVNRNQQLQGSSYGQTGQQHYQRQIYGQQLNQGSPQPPTQRWPNQYGNTQATYQNQTQFRNTVAYGQNAYGPQQQGQSYTQQGYQQQRPSSNGRSTPVSNIAPAPPRVSSPMKPLQSADMARPNSATPQPQQAPQAQMNGVQTNGS
ncbi:Hypothetical protein D9617_26g078300 [Elsinoe fawcettii]|nr:Hypothetical protein D9617_26g078300 [Elsinoe fawcettii]